MSYLGKQLGKGIQGEDGPIGPQGIQGIQGIQGLKGDTGDVTLAQLNAKQDTLVSGTNIKTINGITLLGSENITTPDTIYTLPNATSTVAGGVKVRLNGTTAYFTIDGTTA